MEYDGWYTDAWNGALQLTTVQNCVAVQSAYDNNKKSMTDGI